MSFNLTLNRDDANGFIDLSVDLLQTPTTVTLNLLDLPTTREIADAYLAWTCEVFPWTPDSDGYLIHQSEVLLAIAAGATFDYI